MADMTAVCFGKGVILTAVITVMMSISAAVPAVCLPAGGQDQELMDAVRQNDASRAEKSLEDGADPNTVYGPSGSTPLMIAAGAGNVRLVNLLMEAGADPAAVDRNGDTAIHYAVDGGRKYAFDALADGGSVYGVPDQKGLSLSERARRAGYPQLAQSIDEKVAQTKDDIARLGIEMYDEINDGDLGEAAEMSGRVYELSRAVYGERDEKTLAALEDHAHLSMRSGRYEEAGESYGLLYGNARKVYGPASEQAAVAANNLGAYNYYMSKPEEAAGYFQEAYDAAAGGPGQGRTAEVLRANLLKARSWTGQGEPGRGGEGPRFIIQGVESAQHGDFILGSSHKGGLGVTPYVILVVLSFLLVSAAAAYLLYRLSPFIPSGGSDRNAARRFEAVMSMNLAKLSERLERYDTAVKHYEKALAVVDEDFQARFHLARIYQHKLKNLSRARFHYLKLIDTLPPGNTYRSEASDAVSTLRKDL